ncbi:MAG: insulinase family protein [Acidobacteria bacterium]|nr:insulinase family protein [Acidobacteriota bacterium]
MSKPFRVSGARVDRLAVRRAIAACVFAVTLSPLLAAQDVQLNVIERTLKNGMKVLMVERHDAPTVSLVLRFKVGGVDDPMGETGIAHFLEHMMFKGTKTYGTTNYQAEVPLMEKIDRIYAEIDAEQRKRFSAFEKPDEANIKKLQEEMAAVQKEQDKYTVKDELWQTYQRVGGVGLNASTGHDSTQYFVSLPSNQLELWAYLESDRIANPVFREFYPERDVVHEERRLRTDTQPPSLLWEMFSATAYQAHPYHRPIIGWASDIDNLQREQVLQYFKTFYAPNNCIAAIVGDINPDKTVAIMEKYFGPLQAQPQPRRKITEEPPQVAERRVLMEVQAQPRLYIGYHTPQIGHEDSYALDVFAALLSGVSGHSRTGRLYKSLVLEKKVALQAAADSMTNLYPGLFVITASPTQGKTGAEIEKDIYDEIARLQKEPPTEEELTRVRNAVDARMIRSMRSNFYLAYSISAAQHLAGNWRFILTERERTKAVTAQDVQNVAKKYFKGENRTVAELRTKAPGESEPNAAGPVEARQ